MGMGRIALLVVICACSGKSAPTTVTTADRTAPAGGATTGGAAPTHGATGIGSAAPTPPAPQGPASNATLAEVGLEAASLDRSADPCVDFYQFACGGWLRANPIPADRPAWGRMSELQKKNHDALLVLAEEAAKRPGDKVGDYYASCMDDIGIDKAGTTAIKPLLAKTQGVKDAKTWFAALTELHKSGIWVVWNAFGESGLDDATKNFTWLDSSGLGLPDRDYYDQPSHAQTLAGYKDHVGRMLALVGTAKPERAAADVIAIETALAKVTKTAVEKRDPKAMNNPHDLKALGKRVKSVDWKAYFKAFGVTPSAKILVTSPGYFAAIDGVRKQFKPAQWASYFTYHLVLDMAFALPKAFDDEAFALERLVRGTPQQQPREERCVRSAGTSIGELLGKLYVDKYFSPAAKQTTRTLFDAIVKVMNDELGAITWMAEPTRKTAQAKLAKLVPMVGYPDKWRSYDFKINRDDFAGNVLRAAAAETKRRLARSGKPYDRGEWYANTFDVDAYYNASANNTALLAGILQTPFFGAERAIAANMGGIGMVIGHELTHGFDDQGAKFDAQGNLKNWWAPADQAQFEAKGKCVAAQYATFEVLPKQFINGELTLGENIADLGGVKMAYLAYRALRKDAAQPIVADGFTEDQVFFLATAQVACGHARKEDMQRRLTADPHSPPKFRVYGKLRNLPEFAQAFSCAPGTPMRPTQTCSVW